MKLRYLISFSLTFIGFALPAQEAANHTLPKDSFNYAQFNYDRYEFYLVNSLDTTKKIKLITKEDYQLTVSVETEDTNIRSQSHLLDGILQDVQENYLIFERAKESIDIEYHNRLSSHTELDFSSYDYLGSENLKLVSLADVRSISYQNPLKMKLNSFGTTSSIIGLILSSVFAPLVSIDYQNGFFNRIRYYKVAAFGLGAIAVGVPFIAINKPKTYHLCQKGIKRDAGFWYLEKKARPLVRERIKRRHVIERTSD